MHGFAVIVVINGGAYLLNLRIVLKKLNALGNIIYLFFICFDLNWLVALELTSYHPDSAGFFTLQFMV